MSEKLSLFARKFDVSVHPLNPTVPTPPSAGDLLIDRIKTRINNSSEKTIELGFGGGNTTPTNQDIQEAALELEKCLNESDRGFKVIFKQGNGWDVTPTITVQKVD